MSKESSIVWPWLKDARLYWRDDLHLGRLENSVGSGHPDVEGAIGGQQFWIELKYVDLPKRKTTNLDLKHVRDSQVEWHYRRQRSGVYTCFLIQVGSGKEAYRVVIDGRFAQQLQDGVTEEWLLAHGHVADTPVDAIRAACLKAL